MHVLGAPPAFILSQDRTLRSKSVRPSGRPVSLDCVRWVRARRRIPLIRIRVNRIDVCLSHFEISLAVSSSISSIAVSGSQGSPRHPAGCRARNNYTHPRAPRGRQSGGSTSPTQFSPSVPYYVGYTHLALRRLRTSRHSFAFLSLLWMALRGFAGSSSALFTCRPGA